MLIQFQTYGFFKTIARSFLQNVMRGFVQLLTRGYTCREEENESDIRYTCVCRILNKCISLASVNRKDLRYLHLQFFHQRFTLNQRFKCSSNYSSVYEINNTASTQKMHVYKMLIENRLQVLRLILMQTHPQNRNKTSEN